MNEISKIAKTTVTYLFGSVSSKLVAFFMIRVYTSYINPSDYGLYDVSITYATLFSSIIFLDIWSGMMRYMFDFKYNKEKYVVVKSGTIIFVSSTIVYTIFIFIFSLFVKMDYPIWVYLYGISISAQNFYGYLARGFGHNKMFAISGIAGTFVNSFFNILLLVVFKFSYEALYISYIAGVFVQVIILERTLKSFRSIITSKVDFNLIRSLFRFSLPLSINSASYWFLNSYSRIAITNYLGPEQNGMYAIATRFGVMINLVATSFTMAWQEMAFTKTGNDRDTATFYSSATITFLLLLIQATVLIIPIVYIIFPIFVSSSYSDSKIIIPIYILATVLGIFSTFLANILTAYKRTDVIFYSTAIAGIINIILITLTMQRFGVISAAYGLLLGYMINCAIRIHLIRKEITYRIEWKSLGFIFLLLVMSLYLYYYQNIIVNSVFSVVVAIYISFSYREKIMTLFRLFRNRIK